MRPVQHAADLDGLGTFVRERRRLLGLTQTELGERLGWVQERISLLERGKYGMPSLPGLASLAAALETSLSELVGAAGFTQILDDESQRTAEAREELISLPVERSEHVRLLHDQSSRLRTGLSILQDKLSTTQQQVVEVLELRTQLQMQRREIDSLMESMRPRS